jgi:hypothetical protein
MPSRRYTLRLPRPLDGRVQAHLQATGLPFADLMREALTTYLADTSPTGADTPLTPERTAQPTGEPTGAATLQRHAEQLADLAQRVERLEQERTSRRHPADRAADTCADRTLTPADSPAATPPTGAATPVPPRRPGRPSGPLRPQILALLQAHPAGLRAEELRVYLQTRRPIGDTLAGMVRGGVIRPQGDRAQRRYVATEPSPHDHT